VGPNERRLLVEVSLELGGGDAVIGERGNHGSLARDGGSTGAFDLLQPSTTIKANTTSLRCMIKTSLTRWTDDKPSSPRRLRVLP